MGGKGSGVAKAPVAKASYLTPADCQTMIERWRGYKSEAERFTRLADQLEQMMHENRITYAYPGHDRNKAIQLKVRYADEA